MKHQFELPIGDWSDDGHGKKEVFIVNSNVPVSEVREAFFNAVKLCGHSPEDMCSDYQDDEISTDQIKELGLNGNYHDEDGEMMSRGFAQLVIDFISHWNTTVDLELAPEMETLPFYGYDDQGRHISGLGYGLFD